MLYNIRFKGWEFKVDAACPEDAAEAAALRLYQEDRQAISPDGVGCTVAYDDPVVVEEFVIQVDFQPVFWAVRPGDPEED